MRWLRAAIIGLLATCAVEAQVIVPINVQKFTDGTNALTAPLAVDSRSGLTILSGGSETLNSGSTFVVNGTFDVNTATMTFPTTSATIARTDALQTFTGVQTFSSPPSSTVATGTAPLTITSTTVVPNLDASYLGAVNQTWATPPAIGNTTPNTGAFSTLSSTGNFTPSQTNGIVGTTTNNNANAGSVGEYVTASATAVSLTTGTPTNVTSISLTAGDWDVYGTILLIPAGTTVVSTTTAGINTTSATVPANTDTSYYYQLITQTGNNSTCNTNMRRESLSSTTNVYLVVNSYFTVSTMTCQGTIYARRVR